MSRCRECDEALHWESFDTGEDERWLGTCSGCSHMEGVIIAEKATVSSDPLRDFLGVPDRDTPTPAWIRFFRLTSSAPWHMLWQHQGSCNDCSATTTFSTALGPDPRWQVQLCLNCGRTAVGALTGSDWFPACLAVKKARRLLLRPLPPWWGNYREYPTR